MRSCIVEEEKFLKVQDSMSSFHDRAMLNSFVKSWRSPNYCGAAVWTVDL